MEDQLTPCPELERLLDHILRHHNYPNRGHPDQVVRRHIERCERCAQVIDILIDLELGRLLPPTSKVPALPLRKIDLRTDSDYFPFNLAGQLDMDDDD